MQESQITIERHEGVYVLRDDLLPGGTKSVLMPVLLDSRKDEYVYASPVYGAFQIALSIYAKEHGKKATIFCAKRADRHRNTELCLAQGATVYEIPYGYLSNIEKQAREYCIGKPNVQKLVFGAHTQSAISEIAARCKRILVELRHEGVNVHEIWCAIGSGTLVESILYCLQDSDINVHGVIVGAAYENKDKRLTLHHYPKSFDKDSAYFTLFQSMPNYDRKAFETLINHRFANASDYKGKNILFWNVY